MQHQPQAPFPFSLIRLPVLVPQCPKPSSSIDPGAEPRPGTSPSVSLHPVPLSPQPGSAQSCSRGPRAWFFLWCFLPRGCSAWNNRGRKGRCPAPGYPRVFPAAAGAGPFPAGFPLERFWQLLPCPGASQGDLSWFCRGLLCSRSGFWSVWCCGGAPQARGFALPAGGGQRCPAGGALILFAPEFWIFELFPLFSPPGGCTTAGGARRSCCVGDGTQYEKKDYFPGWKGSSVPCPSRAGAADATLAAERPSGHGACPEQQKSPGRERFQEPSGSQLSGKSLPGSWDTPRASRDH